MVGLTNAVQRMGTLLVPATFQYLSYVSFQWFNAIGTGSLCAALAIPSYGGLYTDLTALHWSFYP